MTGPHDPTVASAAGTAPGLVALSATAHRILHACRAVGGVPLIVGGTVRDAILSGDTIAPAAAMTSSARAAKDVDIEVFGDVRETDLIAELIRVARAGVARVDVARVDGVDRASSVLEVACDGERFDVSISSQIGFVESAGSRGFTVDALAWDPATSSILDPVGGRSDLAARLIRLVSPDGFVRDPLQVLRAVQLVARFGFALDDETAAAARRAADAFPSITTDRIRIEWQSIATHGRHIGRALTALHEVDWLRWFPALAATRGLEQDPRWHPEGDVLTHLGLAAEHAAALADAEAWPDSERELIVLAALLHDVGKPTTTVRLPDGRITSHGHESVGAPIAEAFLEAIGADASLRRRVGMLVREHMIHVSVAGRPSRASLRRLIRRLGEAGVTLEEWAAVVASDVGGRGDAARPNPAAVWLEVAAEVAAEVGAERAPDAGV
ncbi:HD domain-containing protein [Frondihabitans cladoniiphilus]|uniref:CCA tRNA nucleotidyltransferase n=1 Tax=Frondihabitans cladoniiphilus TaxID=715785 RepID=A0ABP8VMM3_9MICO